MFSSVYRVGLLWELYERVVRVPKNLSQRIPEIPALPKEKQ